MEETSQEQVSTEQQQRFDPTLNDQRIKSNLESTNNSQQQFFDKRNTNDNKNSKQMAADKEKMFSSRGSNMLMSDQNSGSHAAQSRGGTQGKQREPALMMQGKGSSRPDYNYRHKSKDYTTAGPDQVQNPRRMGTSENRGNKIQKTAYDKKKDWQAFPVKVQNLNQMIQIRKKRPKLKYNDRVAMKAQNERQIYSQQVQYRDPKKFQKILDGFLLLHSCRVKLPHEAIRSKLSGESIVDVREEDLVYFKQNLKYLDISDNQIFLEQLVNLQNLEELDMQYNNLDHIELQPGAFPQMQILHLSYNKIPPSHLSELQYLQNLRILEIASNDFCTLPSDLSFLKTLEEINLSSNNFSTDSVLVNPSKLFLTLATIPKLKKLNLSRNKFRQFHSEEFPQDNLNLEDPSQQIFPFLEELNFAFNIVEQEEHLLYTVVQLPSLLYLVITGNPFAIKGDSFATENLEQILHSKGGKLINETLNPPTYLRRHKAKNQDKPPLMLNYNFPQSRELMVIRDEPDIAKEERELFYEDKQDDQIKAIEYRQEDLPFQQPPRQQQFQDEQEDQENQRNENKFFITEDETVRGGGLGQKQKQVQHQQEVETPIIQEENEVLQEKTTEPQMFDEDFGMLKMEKFKQQCRSILGEPKKNKHSSKFHFEQTEQDEELKEEQLTLEDGRKLLLYRDYESTLDIVSAYKSLKQAVSKPATVHANNTAEGNKGYLKMTIAATQHSKSKMAKDLLEYSLATKQSRVSNTAEGGPRPIMSASGNEYIPMAQKRPSWRKTKQEVIDEKVERLFETYKIMDEVNKNQRAIYGQSEEENKRKQKNKYFPEDEEDDD